MDLEVFNYARLLKWYWCWYESGNRLWVPLLRQMAAIQAGIPLTPTFLTIKEEILAFFNCMTTWIPGDGQMISLWDHDWGQGCLKMRLPNLFSFARDTGITLSKAKGELATDMLRLFRPNLSITAQEELQNLCQWLLGMNLQQGCNDRIIWRSDATGKFSLKSAYKSLKGGPRLSVTISEIWRVKAPPRMIIFAWLAIRNNILTHDNLQKRGWSIVSRCNMCKTATETVIHLFQECAFTLQLYQRLKNNRPQPGWPVTPTIDLTDKDKTGDMTPMQKTSLLIMQFVIWRERCARSFADTYKDIEELIGEILWNRAFYE